MPGSSDPERRALARGRLDLHGAAVGLGDGGHDRQAEPGAALGAAAGRVGAVEALEDPVGLVGRQARALVGDLDGDEDCPSSETSSSRTATGDAGGE